ncbi:methylmalonyl-CoA mutase subunit beta [Yinghuangia soli]|uniref:Methylmalonyl-CoA mutase subunit beta n=1 Tax=Yinghuangia soli TaxID=2908204 RepID=A0AA41Q1D7_9ACTN|nr:methylmalonyl-CoA mutase subunit beta [Yinghuangia soli]MCF2529778.1 methylmalonyl-CoA mutase subunit beta [Yinghuangia soli]
MTEATVDGGTSTGSTFASQFPQPTREQWQGLVAGVLRKSRVIGADDAPENPEDLLATTTYDGIRLAPLYTADDASPDAGVPGLPSYVRGARAAGSALDGWDVRQLHADPDPARTAEAVLADLENGVSSVFLQTGPGALDPAELPRVLTGVLLDLAPVVLDPGADFAPAADALLAVFRGSDVAPGEIRGNLGADPLAVHARTGRAPQAGADLAAAAGLAVRAHAEFPNLQAIAVDAQPYHEAGASEGQELGAATAAGVAYLRALTAAGLDVDTALGLVEFRFAATADQFLTIAKLRAARRLWARVAQASGAASGAQKQHAVTSWSMATRRDPWVNMLRTTVAAFAAGVGGADAVTVRPFDAALGLPDAFARRIARNTQALLLEESHLAQVIDPAGGSWYVEKLTDELAHSAWAFFQDIERAGGIAAALDSGLVADRIAEVRAAREKALATRTDPLTGVSEFPNLTEEPVVREPAAAPEGGGLPRVRYAEGYEALRDRSDAILAAKGERPTVFLATLGPVAQHTARAQFTRNLFAAGGIDAVEAGPVETDDELVAAYRAAGTPQVVAITSSDKVYADAEKLRQTTARLHSAGAHHVFLAGAPKKWAESNVDGYVYLGCDALQVLDQAYSIIAGADR